MNTQAAPGAAATSARPATGRCRVTINLFWILISASTFIVFAGLAWYFGFSGLTRNLETRRARIEQGLRDADEARREREAAADERQKTLAEARREAQEILARAQRLAEEERERGIAETRAEIERQREQAVSEINAERQRAVAEVRSPRSPTWPCWPPARWSARP